MITDDALLVVDLVAGLDELNRVLKQERLDHDEWTVHVEQQLAEVLELENVCEGEADKDMSHSAEATSITKTYERF